MIIILIIIIIFFHWLQLDSSLHISHMLVKIPHFYSVEISPSAVRRCRWPMTILTSSHFFSESSDTHCSLCLFPPVYHSYVSSRHCIVFCFASSRLLRAVARPPGGGAWRRGVTAERYRGSTSVSMLCSCSSPGWTTPSAVATVCTPRSTWVCMFRFNW